MADTPDYVNGQPEPVKNDGPSMHDLVISDIRGRNFHVARRIPVSDIMQELMIDELTKRKKYGLEKYGTILQANNGRNPDIDAVEEIVDLLVYLRQAMVQRPTDAFIQIAYAHTIEAWTAIIKSRMVHGTWILS